MSVSVRAATGADLDAIVRVGRLTWPSTYAFAGAEYVAHGVETWWSTEFIERSLENTLWRVAEVDGQVAAAGNLDLRPETPTIWMLYVLPDHQGRGLGALLLDELVASVPLQRRLVTLEYVAGNEPAARFYERHGFREVRRTPSETEGWPDQVWAERPVP